MKKMIGITLFFPLCIVFILSYVQVLSKQLNFPLESSLGDASLLEGVTLETTVFTNTPTSPLVSVENGVSKVSYVEANRYDFDRIPPISQREEFLQEHPVLDESKKERITEGYFSYDSAGIPCEVYAYPQSEAQLQIAIDANGSNRWIKNTPFNTLLNVYPQDNYTIKAMYTICPSRQDVVPHISVDQYFDPVEVEQASNQDFYMMPTIRPNMDGEASVYRFHEAPDDSTPSQMQGVVVWEEKGRYDIPVTKGMYGLIKVVNDQIYVWTWKEDVLTIQVLDEELNMIHEVKEDFPLSSMSIENPGVYQNDSYLIFSLQHNLVVYDLDSGDFIRQYDLDSMKASTNQYALNDVYYKNDKLYVSVNEYTLSQYDYNPNILVFDEKEKIYHAKLKITNQMELDNDEVYTRFTMRDNLMFVR